MSPLFLEMMSSYFSHSLSNAFCVLGEMFLSSSSTFLCTGASAGDFRKSSSFFSNGFSKNSLSFSCRFLSGIQFLGISFSSCSMVQISSTYPSLQSFSVKATMWSFGRCKCSWWLKFTMMNGVVASGSLSLRSAIMGYVHMLGFALNHSWSGMTSTLMFSVLLMSTSTTAQDRGGTLMFLYKDTKALDGNWYSAVSAMTSLFCVSWRVFAFVHEMPMQFWIEKSLPKMMGLFKCSHTMNVW